MKPPTKSHPLFTALREFAESPRDEVCVEKAVGHIEKYLETAESLLKEGMYWRVGFSPSQALSENLKSFFNEEQSKKES